ncbi:MAG: Isopropylmalate/homocitrate/citramalate synthases [uncultured Paraburkholderia sp.]|nr:MAG: Isopropylmalate/homocitrate/citramalate synthases [uncultured Paraburkholderia sp.]
MRPDTADRFDKEFAPRIAEAIAACFATTVHTEVLPYGGPGRPTRLPFTRRRSSISLTTRIR